ncbi:hypothetical protein GMRT_22690 [Giardia muris]|uniref:IQ calmodulin-binding motif-containing protein n=1 Tax=Giardia muris TaxID=5742 RepID=A0A4Z1T4U6_GIAMU|nr:hypothetical protein GMRT_22690 [Giardia muris]|eukprot:TNJ29023.1 hypothetical protein GMRT_22690 [Giardia muris]
MLLTGKRKPAEEKERERELPPTRSGMTITPLTGTLNAAYKARYAAGSKAKKAAPPRTPRPEIQNPHTSLPTQELEAGQPNRPLTTSTDVAHVFDQLSSTLQEVKKNADLSTKLVGQAKPQLQITAGDLSALPPSGQVAATKVVEEGPEAGSLNIDNFDFGTKNMGERVAMLRAHPELLKRFMNDCEEERKKARVEQQSRALEARIQKREFLSRIERGTLPQSNPRCYSELQMRRGARTPYAATYHAVEGRVTTSGGISREILETISQDTLRKTVNLRRPLSPAESRLARTIRESNAGYSRAETRLSLGEAGEAVEVDTYLDTALFATALPPLIPDYVKYNRKLSQTDYYAPETKALREGYRALQEETRADIVLTNFEAAQAWDQERRLSDYDSKIRNAPGPILPQTFILQRNRLGELIYLTARLAALFRTAQRYSEATLNNAHIRAAATRIQYTFRAYAARRDLRKMQAAATRIQLAGLMYVNRMRLARRRQCLTIVGQTLLRLYRQNTWPAAVYQHYHGALCISTWLQHYRRRKLARLEYIRAALRVYDASVTEEYLRQAKVRAAEAFLRAESKKKTKRDPTTGKKILPVPPSTRVSPEEVAAAVFTPDLVNIISRLIYKHIAEVNADELDKIFMYNIQHCRGHMGACFSFVPTDECLTAVVHTAKACLATEGTTREDLRVSLDHLLADQPHLVHRVVLDDHFGAVYYQVVDGRLVERDAT